MFRKLIRCYESADFAEEREAVLSVCSPGNSCSCSTAQPVGSKCLYLQAQHSQRGEGAFLGCLLKVHVCGIAEGEEREREELFLTVMQPDEQDRRQAIEFSAP